MRCITCDREMRLKRDKESSHLVTAAARGLCSGCYSKVQKLGKHSKVDNTKLIDCMHCHRAMRPYKTRAADYPETVPRYGKKTCWTCNQRINTAEAEIVSTLPDVSAEEYLAVKRLVKDDLELLQVLGLDRFEEVNA